MLKSKRQMLAIAAAPQRPRYVAIASAVGVLVLFTYLYVINAWMSDDAYIDFRTIDNFLRGYGLRWNVAERVQSYTNPLWLFLIMLARFFTGEFYFTSLVISYLLCLGALGIVWALSRGGGPFLASAAILLSSKAFMDFTSSGLESPLSFFLIALFWGLLPTPLRAPRPSARQVLVLYLVASLAFLNRPDAVLLVASPAIALFWKDAKGGWAGAISRLILGFLPAIAWELFSLVYYGFLVPNTYYAKVEVNLPLSAILYQGARYFANSLAFDPVTLTTVFIAVVLLLMSRRTVPVLGALSILLYLGYTLKVGGDFMSGRFFAMPFLLAVLLVVPCLAQRRYVLPALIALLVLYNVVDPYAPIKTDPHKPWNDPCTADSYVYDEAGGYRRGTSLLLYRPFGNLTQGEFPKYPRYRDWANFGLKARTEKLPVIVMWGPGMGFLGYNAGPDVHIIDVLALADPLLARLPVIESVRKVWIPGHAGRVLPVGYCESALTGHNKLVEPAVRDYYDQIRLVTRGDFFTVGRWKAIWDLNLVHYIYSDKIDQVVPMQEGVFFLGVEKDR